MRIAVVLSGCGYLDGSEIHESVIALLCIEKYKHQASCYAPDIIQNQTIDHLNAKPLNENRNVLTESSRIARGEIENIKNLEINNYDALIFPGGFGATTNLSNFKDKGHLATINPIIETIIKKAHLAKKPIGAICISPVLVAGALSDFKPILTIGEDDQTAAELEKLGAKHISCSADGIVIDHENLLVSCPAYMNAKNILEVFNGIDTLILQLNEFNK